MNNYNILDQSYYINRDQSAEGCFYFPEPEYGVPVVFPGQCNESIAAVPGFSMNAVRWIPIESDNIAIIQLKCWLYRSVPRYKIDVPCRKKY